ncbi:PEGA domain-containing protein [Thermospira aquatica]|uniref:PEGA domain-containing protein n=1 Tax=Thermospira aquatica TaxID=2828656 RepID=A0AAX3BBZ2_9SPIR|nr:PEGA domain-containing protein [Thermospira aquatica]URA09770.1 PEGA domain-containing protein [Thermospira aquatica]
MKKHILMLLLLPLVMWGESLTLVAIGAQPKKMDSGSYQLLVNQITYNLNDLNDVLNNVYLPVNTAVDWANSIIQEINRTNTNMTIIKNKLVPPKKLRTIRAAPFSRTFFKSLSNYVRFQQALNISIATASTGYTITFKFYQSPATPKPSIKSINIPSTLLTNTPALNTLLKETLITLFNQWDRYYYQPEVTGKLSLKLVPAKAKNLQILSLPSVILKPGQNILPLGSYPILVMADGYDPFFTNVTVGFNPTTCTIRLTATRKIRGAAEDRPKGHLFLNADYPGAQFLILEDSIQGRTPFFMTNINAGVKTIVFEETANYKMKQETFTLEPNVLNMHNVSLSRKGASFVIKSAQEGATVIINKKKMGAIQNGSFETQVSPGLHLVTVIKDGYLPFRTNITLKEEQKTIMVDLNPRPVVGLLISTPERGLITLVEKRRVKTPATISLSESPQISIEFLGTNDGYMNVSTNVEWSLTRFNVVLAQLTPIFGDLIVSTTPDDAYVSINNIPRGRSVVGGLEIPMLPARTVKVRIEKEGYKTLSTNIFIQPNMRNSLSLKLKDAPAKLYVSTVPEKGFEAFVNDDFVGYSSSNVFSVEMGSVTLKLNKRGFKTIVTNFIVDSRGTKILTFTSTPGVGEDDVIDSSLFFLQQAIDAASQNDFIASSSNFALALGTLRNSEYANFPRIKQIESEILSQKKELGENILIADLYIDVSTNYQYWVTMAEKGEIAASVSNFKLLALKIDQSGLTNTPLPGLRTSIRNSYANYAWKQIEPEVLALIASGDTASQNENYEDSIKYYNRALSMIQEMEAFENETLSNTYVDIQLKQKTAMNKKMEKELAGDAKVLMESLTPMVYEADRKAENGQYAEALRLYQNALAKIDTSPFKDYSAIKEQRSRIEKHIENVQKQKKQADVWWPKMVRNWSGVSLTASYTGIESKSFSFSPNMNHMIRAHFGIHPLPFLQLNIGGMYNMSENYIPYALAVGGGLRIPLLAQWSLFADTQVLWSDFIVFDIAKNDLVDVGMDLKFAWFGIRLAYTFGFQDYFKTSQQGISAGITFWFTEE